MICQLSYVVCVRYHPYFVLFYGSSLLYFSVIFYVIHEDKVKLRGQIYPTPFSVHIVSDDLSYILIVKVVSL